MALEVGGSSPLGHPTLSHSVEPAILAWHRGKVYDCPCSIGGDNWSSHFLTNREDDTISAGSEPPPSTGTPTRNVAQTSRSVDELAPNEERASAPEGGTWGGALLFASQLADAVTLS